MNEVNTSPVGEAEVAAYMEWILGENEILTEEERTDFEARYQSDPTFRAETNSLRSGLTFIMRNIDQVLAYFGPQAECTSEEREELWQKLQKRLAQKRSNE